MEYLQGILVLLLILMTITMAAITGFIITGIS